MDIFNCRTIYTGKLLPKLVKNYRLKKHLRSYSVSRPAREFSSRVNSDPAENFQYLLNNEKVGKNFFLLLKTKGIEYAKNEIIPNLSQEHYRNMQVVLK